MHAEIDFDIIERKYKLIVFRDLNELETEAIIFETRVEKVPEGQPLPCSYFYKTEGDILFKALATALQKAGYLPESATTAELKAVREELAILRKQHQQLIDSTIIVAKIGAEK